jgi:hypothetical protein
VTAGSAPRPIAAFLAEMARTPWFASCGASLNAAETKAASAYVAALGLGELPVAGVKDWRHAQTLAQRPDWSRAWWEAESQAEKILHRQGESRFGENDFLAMLTVVTEESSSIHAAALVALARAGLKDEGLAKAAAGAASQACHQAALAHLAAAGSSHAFACKFRLFAAGRWPLGIVQTRAIIPHLTETHYFIITMAG